MRNTFAVMMMAGVVACGSMRGATVVGSVVECSGSALGAAPNFLPLSTPLANGTNTILDRPKQGTVTNGVFSQSLAGGLYRVEFGAYGRSVKILVPPNDTNVWQFNVLAALATNLPSYTWTNVWGQISGRVLAGTNVTLVTNFAGQANEQIVVSGSAGGPGGSGQTNWAVSAITNAGTAAYSNASAFVLKAGDTMTGQLVGPNMKSTAALYVDTAKMTDNGSGKVVAELGFSGDGSSLTALSASALGSGTVPDGRFPGTLPAASGVNLTALNASSLASGTVDDARLSGNVSLLGSAIDLSGSEATGILAGGRFPALTGDITTSAGSVATTLAAGNAGNLNSGTLLAARMPALTGDITTSAGAVATTLASVGSAGTYRSVTTDAKGRVTAGTAPTTFSGYGLSDTSANLAATLTDETGAGSGTPLAVFNQSPTIVTPTVASFVNATHNHQSAAGGGTLDAAAVASGTLSAGVLPALGAGYPAALTNADTRAINFTNTLVVGTNGTIHGSNQFQVAIWGQTRVALEVNTNGVFVAGGQTNAAGMKVGGALQVVGAIVTAGNVTCNRADPSGIHVTGSFNGGGYISSTILGFYDSSDGSAINRIQFGGNASTNPSLQPVSQATPQIKVVSATTNACDLVVSGAITATNGLLNGTANVKWVVGTGSPENAVTAPVGSLFSRTDGGANTSLYVKESGSSSTGWVAK